MNSKFVVVETPKHQQAGEACTELGQDDSPPKEAAPGDIANLILIGIVTLIATMAATHLVLLGV